MNEEGKWSEVSQLEVALNALKTQPYDAQVRMLGWLRDRLADDYRKAIREREEEARARIRAKIESAEIAP